MSSPPWEPNEKRSIVALLTAMTCSSTAVAMVTTVLGKLVFDLTGSELALGLLGLAEFAPAALLIFVTGPVADRLDRRKVACVALLLEAATIGAMALYAASDPTSTGPIFVLVVAFGTFRAFANPATRSLPADTVSAERLPWLVARQSITWQVAGIFGPVLGGFLYVAGVGIPFALGAALVVVGALVILLVQPRPVANKPERTRPSMKDAMAGLRFVRSEPILLGAITLDLFAVLFGGAVALLPAIAEDRLGVGAVGLGWLRAAIGIGAAAVTLVLAFKPLHRRVGPILLASVAIFGVGTIVLGVTTSFAIAFLSLMVLSGADAVSVFIRSTLVPLVTPHDMRGRVLAVEMVFIGASNELGAFESGVVGQLLGPAAAVVLGGVGTLAVAGLWFRIFPALARVDRFPEAADPAELAAEVIEQESIDRGTLERDGG
ncbi:MAG: MFS transporter [Acidimicrobiia bacterium]